MKRTLRHTLLMLSHILLFVVVNTANASVNSVNNIYLVDGNDSTKIVFNLESKANYDVFRLSNPDRIVVDLNNTRLNTHIPSASRLPDSIKRIRSSHRFNNARRFVIDTRGKLDYTSYRLKPNSKFSHRLVLKLSDANQIETAAVSNSSMSVVDQLAKRVSQATARRNIIVAIDAGHGGQDPGATGKNGSHEKDVTLRIARKLQALVNKQPGMRGVLTRKDDRYITLRGRIRLARRAKADMFISIHADSSRSREARGSSVFVLSERGASDEAAKWLADRENAADLIGGVSLDDKDATLAKVLLDLSQSATIESSDILAKSILKEIHRVAPVHKHTVQHARFVVLKSPDIPSLLVETAFISNPSEERRLNSNAFENKLAKAMLRGITHYFANNAVTNNRQTANTQTLKVRAGDTLSELAQAYQVSVSQFKQVNNLQSDQLYVGQVLQVPF